MTDPDVQRMLLDAEVHTAAHGIRAWLPEHFTAVNDRHRAHATRLRADGATAAADAFDRHDPMWEDGILCGATGATYPCAVLRHYHPEGEVWADLVTSCPPGWERALDEQADADAEYLTGPTCPEVVRRLGGGS